MQSYPYSPGGRLLKTREVKCAHVHDVHRAARRTRARFTIVERMCSRGHTIYHTHKVTSGPMTHSGVDFLGISLDGSCQLPHQTEGQTLALQKGVDVVLQRAHSTYLGAIADTTATLGATILDPKRIVSVVEGVDVRFKLTDATGKRLEARVAPTGNRFRQDTRCPQ